MVQDENGTPKAEPSAAERRFADQAAGLEQRLKQNGGSVPRSPDANEYAAMGLDPRAGERRAPPVNLKSRAAVADVMEKVFASIDVAAFERARDEVFAQCRKLREAGQAEYAHDEDNAFANFMEDEKDFGITREMDLLIFANKHWRGIRAWACGHRSQREDVRGRIGDLIVYAIILRAMADERDATS